MPQKKTERKPHHGGLLDNKGGFGKGAISPTKRGPEERRIDRMRRKAVDNPDTKLKKKRGSTAGFPSVTMPFDITDSCHHREQRVERK